MSIGQIRQPVVERHVRNFGFSLMAFGDVFMGYNPATTGHWLVHDRYLSPVRSSDGHLGVLVGFDAHGDPVVNDPAGKGDAGLRRTYRRAELENVWGGHSGGTAYLAYPPGWPTPWGR